MAEKKVTFEQAMARLEEIVKQLEQGDAPLEDALALFEEGTRLMKKCTTQLDKAEQKVNKLWAANKWLLGHEANTGLIERGAFPGIYGENWKINPIR